MKKIIFSILKLAATTLAAILTGVCLSNAAPTVVVETLPNSNESAQVVVLSTGYVSAVNVSSTTITRVDTAFNAAMLAAYGANYQRAEIVVQNNSAGTIFCGYSSSALTVANGFAVYGLGGERYFKIGKGMGIYCLAAVNASLAPATSILIVGGVAWK